MMDCLLVCVAGCISKLEIWLVLMKIEISTVGDHVNECHCGILRRKRTVSDGFKRLGGAR